MSDGRDALGTVREIAGGFTAITIDGLIIGEFATLREAVRAFDGGDHDRAPHDRRA